MSMKRGGFVYTCDFCFQQEEVGTEGQPLGWGQVQLYVPSFDRSEKRSATASKYHGKRGDTYYKDVCSDCIDYETFTITIARSKQLSVAKEQGTFVGNIQHPSVRLNTKPILGMDDELYHAPYNAPPKETDTVKRDWIGEPIGE